MKQNRRDFITTIAAAGATIPFYSATGDGYKPSPESRFPIRIFSKPLDAYDFDFMCECIVKSGIGGFDLTVRPGGKVEPSEVETKLPLLVKEAKKYNLALDMMVTGIVTASDPLTERVLKTASSLGITHYRLGYLEFDYKTGIWESLQKHKASLKEVVALNQKYNIHGDYQNHAGTRVGGPVWDLYELLRELSPEFAGCQYDVRHAMVEGANAWIIGMRLIAPYIKTLAMVNWDLFFRTVKELNISGPITLHIEYPLFEKDEEKLPLLQQQEIIIKKLKKDVDFLNGFLLKYQLL
jgi:L-ribulose-5-phosphate 3-epimerase